MGKFEVGHKKLGGRVTGSLTQRTQNFMQVMEKHNFNAAEALIEIYREAKKTYDNYAIIYRAIEEGRQQAGTNIVPTEDKADKYLKIALDAAKDLASYSFPKLKAIEQQKEDPTKNMTPEEKLQTLEYLADALRSEINGRK